MKPSQTSGFEYRNKNEESPFETFLRYTDEKEKSAEQLAKVVQSQSNGGELHILDIGTGNGEYLARTLSKIKTVSSIKLTLLEPSKDLVKQIKGHFKGLISDSQLTIINVSLEDFDTNESFDIVLASHLFYHLPSHMWPQQLDKMLSLLKPHGKLITVLREEDDAYAFKMAFKPLLFNKDFKALTIDDVLACLPSESREHITRHTSVSSLKIPFDSNQDDTISIIEFYLNKQWHDIPETIQDAAMQFIRDKHSVFKQIDGIAVIEKA